MNTLTYCMIIHVIINTITAIVINTITYIVYSCYLCNMNKQYMTVTIYKIINISKMFFFSYGRNFSSDL